MFDMANSEQQVWLLAFLLLQRSIDVTTASATMLLSGSGSLWVWHIQRVRHTIGKRAGEHKSQKIFSIAPEQSRYALFLRDTETLKHS